MASGIGTYLVVLFVFPDLIERHFIRTFTANFGAPVPALRSAILVEPPLILRHAACRADFAHLNHPANISLQWLPFHPETRPAADQGPRASERQAKAIALVRAPQPPLLHVDLALDLQ